MKLISILLATTALTLGPVAFGATVVPLENQNDELIQKDTGACRNQANDQHPIPDSVPVGGRARGAATGAVAGATAAAVNSQQYENVSNSTKQDYRQNKAASAATAGVVVAGAKQRQDRRQNQSATDQAITANNSVYSSCLQQRGYNVLP
jgi:hypothetical protein